MNLHLCRAAATPGVLVLALAGFACASDDATGADTGGSETESSGDGDPGDGDGDPGDGDGDPGDGDGDSGDGDPGDGDGDPGVVCGNGTVEGDEQCDDGNAIDDDACTNACTVAPPAEPGPPSLDISAIKQFAFAWEPVFGATHYQLLERATPGAEYLQVGADVIGESLTLTVPLHLRAQASYKLAACNLGGCSESAPIDVASNLAEAVGYFKASEPKQDAWFGYFVALSADGGTLAVSAYREDMGTGAVYVYARAGEQWQLESRLQPADVGGNFGFDVALSGDGDTLLVGAPRTMDLAGAAYVFSREQGQWSQTAVLQGSNTAMFDNFGGVVAIAADGDTLAVAALQEASSAAEINGDESDNNAPGSGAVYVFVRDGLSWTQQAYVKASNSETNDIFGFALALADDGNTLAVSTPFECSNAVGIDGEQTDNSADSAGAAYVFVRDGVTWSQQAYIKATNTAAFDVFGEAIALSGDGDTLAVSAKEEDSSAVGVGGDQTDNSAPNAGAVYVYARTGAEWTAQAYVKASNTDSEDWFGASVALSSDGATLAVGAEDEQSAAVGVGGEQTNSAGSAGAVYVFELLDAQWVQSSYVKASNTSSGDNFGISVGLSGDGSTLAVGAYREDGSAPGVDGDQADDSLNNAGAVYLY